MTAHPLQQALDISTEDGLRLTVTEFGTGYSPLKICYVHGLLADSSFWNPLITYLTPHLVQRADQISYDARGHGGSQTPPRDSDNGLATLADDLASVLDGFAGPTMLVAHSVGGFVVLEHARRHPAQYRQRVVSAVLFGTGAETPQWDALRAFRPPAACLRWMRRGRLDGVNAWGHRVLDRRLRALASHAKPGRAQLVPSTAPVDPRVTADIGTSVVSFAAPEGATRTLASVPVRVVAARFDRVFPSAQVRHLATRVPGATFHEIADAGHSLPLSDPRTAGREILTAIDSLDSMQTQLLPVAVGW